MFELTEDHVPLLTREARFAGRDTVRDDGGNVWARKTGAGWILLDPADPYRSRTAATAETTLLEALPRQEMAPSASKVARLLAQGAVSGVPALGRN